MSPEFFPLTTAPQLVRYWFEKGYSADEIAPMLRDNALFFYASPEDLATCERLLTYRRLYDNAAAAILAKGEFPSAEKIAEKVGKDERTVRRWRDGNS